MHSVIFEHCLDMEAKDIHRFVADIFCPEDREFAINFVTKFVTRQSFDEDQLRLTPKQFYFLLKFFSVNGPLLLSQSALPCIANTLNDCVDNFANFVEPDLVVCRLTIVHWRNVYLKYYFGNRFEGSLTATGKKILFRYDRLCLVLKFMALHGKCISRILS